MIDFQCSHCGKKLSVPDNAAGKTGKCNGCGNRITVPQPMQAEAVEEEFRIAPLSTKPPALPPKPAQLAADDFRVAPLESRPVVQPATMNPYQSPVTTHSRLRDDDEEVRYDGIGGWLILPAIGLVLHTLALGYAIFKAYIPFFTSDMFAALTNPQSAHYHSLWMPILMLEVIGGFIMFILTIATLWQMFALSPNFPKLFIGLLIFRLVYCVADVALISQIPNVRPEFKSGLLASLIPTVVACGIWIPYTLVSKRVKGTFGAR